MARVCTISTPIWVSEAVENRQISKIWKCLSTEGVNVRRKASLVSTRYKSMLTYLLLRGDFLLWRGFILIVLLLCLYNLWREKGALVTRHKAGVRKPILPSLPRLSPQPKPSNLWILFVFNQDVVDPLWKHVGHLVIVCEVRRTAKHACSGGNSNRDWYSFHHPALYLLDFGANLPPISRLKHNAAVYCSARRSFVYRRVSFIMHKTNNISRLHLEIIYNVCDVLQC